MWFFQQECQSSAEPVDIQVNKLFPSLDYKLLLLYVISLEVEGYATRKKQEQGEEFLFIRFNQGLLKAF